MCCLIVEKGNKRSRKHKSLHIDSEQSAPVQDAFVWTSHPSVDLLYAETLRLIRSLLIRSRLMSESVVLEIELELFTAMSHTLSPSYSHRVKLPVCVNREVYQEVVEATLTAASVGHSALMERRLCCLPGSCRLSSHCCLHCCLRSSSVLTPLTRSSGSQ